MFNIECCKGQRKCKVFELAKPKNFNHVYLKIGRCSKCKRLFCIIEKQYYYKNELRKSFVRKYGEDAIELFENSRCNILYEIILVKHANSKVAWTYYKTINAETQVRRYMDESGNAGEKIKCPVKVVCA